VKNVQVDEIYSLDQLAESSSYGLIFLFKWKKETDPRETILPEYLPEVFFAQQVCERRRKNNHDRDILNSLLVLRSSPTPVPLKPFSPSFSIPLNWTLENLFQSSKLSQVPLILNARD
jgi:hypothetical protein